MAILLTALGAFVVGVVGTIVGAGGGTFLVPFLFFVVGLRPIEAAGVGLFCVIGTSIGGASRGLSTGLVNTRLATLLEVGLLLGAVGAALLAQRMSDALLLYLFGSLMLILSLLFLAFGIMQIRSGAILTATPRSFFDGFVKEPDGDLGFYTPKRVPLLAGFGLVIGALSGLFGIGGGVVVVPFMNLVSKIPLRAAAATSVLTMSITGAAAGAVHFSHGTIPLQLVPAALVGVIPGSLLGARLQEKLSPRALRFSFSALAMLVALVTFVKATS